MEEPDTASEEDTVTVDPGTVIVDADTVIEDADTVIEDDNTVIEDADTVIDTVIEVADTSDGVGDGPQPPRDSFKLYYALGADLDQPSLLQGGGEGEDTEQVSHPQPDLVTSARVPTLPSVITAEPKKFLISNVGFAAEEAAVVRGEADPRVELETNLREV